MNHENRELLTVIRLESVCRPRSPCVERRQVPLRKDTSSLPKFILLIILLTFPKGLMIFNQGNHVQVVKEIIRPLGTTGHWLWTRLISGDPKHHWGPPVRVGAHGSQVISGSAAQVHVTVGPVGLQSYPVVIYSVPECRIRIDTLSPHIGSMCCVIMAIMVEKAKWNLPELSLGK